MRRAARRWGRASCALSPSFAREQVFLADGEVHFVGVVETLTELTESERTGKSGTQGAWAIDVETPTTLRILAVAPRYRTWLSEVLELPAGQGEQALDVELEQGGTVRGRVLTDAAAEEPVPASVELRSARSGGSLSCVLRAGMDFEFDGLDPGPFTAAVFGKWPGTRAELPEVLLASEDLAVRDGVVTEV
jgi:hypothetical protein